MPLQTIDLDDRQQAALLDVKTIAKLLACSPRHVWRLHDRGAMPAAVRLGALRRWNRQAVEQWLADGCPSRKGGR